MPAVRDPRLGDDLTVLGVADQAQRNIVIGGMRHAGYVLAMVLP